VDGMICDGTIGLKAGSPLRDHRSRRGPGEEGQPGTSFGGAGGDLPP